MNVVIFGSTGMVGKAVLLECIENNAIQNILLINRSPLNVQNSKVKEIIHDDFFDFSFVGKELKGLDACFYCIGVSSMGISEEIYTRFTHDITLKVAETLVENNNKMTFCFVSATGADSSEKGKVMWARVKGKTENRILRMSFKDAYIFRPGYIQPKKGVKSRVKMYNVMYTVFGVFYPILKLCFPNKILTSVGLANAMINAALIGFDKKILSSREINILAKMKS